MGCRLVLVHSNTKLARMSSYSGSGSSTPGNKSDKMLLNNGTSGARNLGKLTSFSEISINTLSSRSGYLSFTAPAARSTEITARIP